MTKREAQKQQVQHEEQGNNYSFFSIRYNLICHDSSYSVFNRENPTKTTTSEGYYTSYLNAADDFSRFRSLIYIRIPNDKSHIDFLTLDKISIPGGRLTLLQSVAFEHFWLYDDLRLDRLNINYITLGDREFIRNGNLLIKKKWLNYHHGVINPTKWPPARERLFTACSLYHTSAKPRNRTFVAGRTWLAVPGKMFHCFTTGSCRYLPKSGAVSRDNQIVNRIKAVYE